MLGKFSQRVCRAPAENGNDSGAQALSNASVLLSAARDGLQNADAPAALAALIYLAYAVAYPDYTGKVYHVVVCSVIAGGAIGRVVFSSESAVEWAGRGERPSRRTSIAPS